MSELVSRFADVVRDRPSRPLIHLPAAEAVRSASDIWNAHQQWVERLRMAGVTTGRLVLSTVGNTPDAAALLLACRSLDAALLPVDAGTTTAEVDALALRFGAAAIVGAGTVRRIADADASCYPGVAMLKLTSGSTGLPKATRTTEAQLVADCTHIVEAMDIRPGDTQIAAIPLSHSYGLGNLLLPLLLQGTACVLRESFVPQQVPADARRFGARVFPGVPFMFQFFLDNAPADGWPASLRRLISAGAPLAAPTARAFHERFGVKIHSFYGATESGGIAFDAGDDIDDSGSVGSPLPGVTVTLREDDDAPAGAGRMHVRSAAVSSGYTDDDGDAFVDGGFLTGDYGARDERGRLLLRGRVSTFVNVAGRKVQPDEVERVLRTMPGVADVRIVAAPDASRGQQIVACIVAAPEVSAITTLAVRQFCAARLAPHKIPRTIVVVDALPLTARGKDDRAALDALVRAHVRG